MKKIALIYDWLISMGGGEKTLAAIADVLPAPIYTLIADRKRFAGTPFAEREIHTSFLQKWPFSSLFYRYYFPFFSKAIESFDVSAYECVVSVSHCVAKGVRVGPHQRHLCYCYTPMRYAWDLLDCYLQTLDPVRRFFAKKMLSHLRKWDRASARSVHKFAANSRYVAERIKRIYNRTAQVIYPPVDTDLIELNEKKEDYFLTVSRMVPYKKIELIVELFAHYPDKKLVVIGDGPQMASVKKKARKNVEILGFQKDEVVRAYLQKARAFFFAAKEDFGIVPIEAQAAGTPVIAYGEGGALETVLSGETGLFFKEQTLQSMAAALQDFEKREWDPIKIRENALRFNRARFQREFLEFVGKE